ncbi:peptidylprolyl isomerase [Thermodesulfobacteriota bacterium]
MKTLLVIIILSILTMVTPSFAENSNRVVAFVNDDVITLHELNTRIQELTGKTSEELRSEAGEDFFLIREEILDVIVDERLIKAKIKELDIGVTKDQVDNYIEYRKEAMKMTHEDLVKQLKAQGVSYETFYEGMKMDLERNKLIDAEIRSKLIITGEELLEYYRNHRKDYEKDNTVRIASIFLVSDSTASDIDSLKKKGKEILERLKKGEKFEALAREFSKGPGAEDGGDLGNIPVSQIDPQIYNVIKGLEEGDVSELINRGNSIQIIKLVDRMEDAVVPFEEVRDEIYQTLYGEEIEKRYKAWNEELRKSVYIKKVL